MRIHEMIVVFALLLIAGTTFGQGRQFDPEEMAKRNTEAMKERLKLNEEQLVKVEDINLAAAKKRSEMMAEAGGDRSAMREKMVAMSEETDKEFKAILTEDQWNEYLVMKEEQRRRRQERGN